MNCETKLVWKDKIFVMNGSINFRVKIKKGLKPIVLPILRWIDINKRYEQIKRIGSFKPYVQVNIEHPPVYTGNKYAGFGVDYYELKNRRGGIVYSFGVGNDISFDLELLKKCPELEVYAFDPTPGVDKWIKSIETPRRFHFYKVGLSDKNGYEKFYMPKDKKYISGSSLHRSDLKGKAINVEMNTLQTIMKKLGHDRLKILKMDIEGSEFSVIPNILYDEIEFDQLLMEVHHRFYKDGNKQIKKIFDLLNDKGYYITDVSDLHDVVTFEKKNIIAGRILQTHF